jgi:ABC-2 type transport system ATP-binding protein
VVGSLLDARDMHPGRSGRRHLDCLAVSNDIPRQRVDAVMELTGLASAARQRVGNYSLGMRQRLGLAAAVLGDPPILVLDEPTNGLDPEGIQWLRTLLRSLADEGRTVFVSSHLITEMALVADQVVVMGAGRLLADVPLAELTGATDHAVREARQPAPDHTSLEAAYFALTQGAAAFRTTTAKPEDRKPKASR